MYQKLSIKIFTFLLISLIAFGCKTTIAHHPKSSHPAGKLPPGQAKKVYGHQSAKAFAPGQQKKRSSGTAVIINTKASGKSKKKK